MPGLRAFWFYEKTVVRHLVRQFRYKKNRQYSRRFPVLYCRLFRYLHRIIISVLLEIIPRHIPRNILPDWCPAAIRRRSGDAIAPQLARHAVVDVVRSGGQP